MTVCVCVCVCVCVFSVDTKLKRKAGGSTQKHTQTANAADKEACPRSERKRLPGDQTHQSDDGSPAHAERL